VSKELRLEFLMRYFKIWRRVVWQMVTNVWEVLLVPLSG